MAEEKDLQIVMNQKDILKKDEFHKSFREVLEVILRKEKTLERVVAELQRSFNTLLDRIKKEHDISLTDLKQRTNQLFVGERLGAMDKEIKSMFGTLKEGVLKAVTDKLKEADMKVSSLKPVKGDKGTPGIPGRQLTREEIEFVLKPLLEEMKKDLQPKWLGSGQSVIVPRELKSISTDTTPAITGAINGSNTDFTLPKAPIQRRGEPYGIQVFLNGVRMREGSGNDYTIAGKTLTFNTAPLSGDILVCDLQY